jgi:Xaa-Pro dipeptidase
MGTAFFPAAIAGTTEFFIIPSARKRPAKGGQRMLPKEEADSRISRLKGRLAEEAIDGALFVYPIDVYYFSGSRQNAALWVPADGSPTLLVRKSYIRALQESLIEDVRPFPPSGELSTFFGGRIKRIGITFDVMPVHQYRFYTQLLPGREFVDISPVNRELRSVKTAWEVEQMRRSAQILCSAFAAVPSVLRPGMTELDLAAEFEYLLKTGGSEGYLRIRAFHQEIVGIIAAGGNAALPGCFDGPVTGRGLSAASPFGPSKDAIREGTPIIIDYGCIFNGYIVDMTRIFAIGGLDPELRRAFDLSLRIQDWIVENMKPGSICEELFGGAASMAEEAGLGDRFMGHSGEQARFVGHGVGLELDELPVLAQKFKTSIRAGQTVAIEPKFVFPGEGVVGIENTCVITNNGCERLTVLADEIVFV